MCRRAHGYGEWERPRSRPAERATTTVGGPAGPRRGTSPYAATAPPPDPDLLIADRDREQVVELLKRATADGRLTIDEFGERVEETYRARTGADLQAVLRQLPYDLPRVSTSPAWPATVPGPGRTTSPAPSRHREPRSAGLSPLLVVGLVFAVVALASGGHVIAAWPLLWLLVVVGRRAWR